MKTAVIPVSLAFAFLAVASGQVNVLTANYDTDRTNSNNNETILNPASVNATTFGKLGAFAVDGEIYAQPLYLSGVSISGQKRNVVYVATMHNSVYAFDADAIGSAALWKVNLGPAVPTASIQAPIWQDNGNFTDIDVEVGILSTPVIDLGMQAIYVVAETVEGSGPMFTLHALSLADGHEIANGPAVIGGSAPGTGDGGSTVEFAAGQLLQRPGLALLNRVLYIAFGSHADDPPWHGWMFAYDAFRLQHRLAVFCATPNGTGSSIWQAGRAPAIDIGTGLTVTHDAGREPMIHDGGSLYVATGNGVYDGSTNFAESIVRLSPRLEPVDWFTPGNYDDLSNNDWDLGSSGVILVPGTNLLITAGKNGSIYVAPRTKMGHVAPADSIRSQGVNESAPGPWDTALWNNQSGPTFYVASSSGGGALKAFQIKNGAISTQVQSQTAPLSTYFAGIAVSSNQGQDGTGLVWLTTADVSQNPRTGILSAFDAGDLTRLLWSSAALQDRDGPGNFAKFVPPTVVNGKVFVPTFSGQLVVYGLLAQPAQPPSKGSS